MISKYSKYLVISVVTAFLLLAPNVVFSKIIFKKVVTTGVGQSLEEAVNNALAEAISMVNGKNIQTKTIIQVLGGESLPQDKKTNSILSQILEAIKSSEDNKDKKVIEASKKEGGIPSDKWVRICFQNLDETRKYKVLEAENFLSLFGISFDCGGCLNEREWEIDWSFRYDKGEEKMGWMISRDKMVDNNNKPN